MGLERNTRLQALFPKLLATVAQVQIPEWAHSHIDCRCPKDQS